MEPLRPSAALRGVSERRALDARPGRAGTRDRALARALGGASQRTPGGLRPRLPRGPPALPGAARALARGPRGSGRPAARAEEVPRGTMTEGRPNPYEAVLRLAREGVAPLDDPVPGMADRPLHVATVIPPFGPGSGGHGTIFKLLAQLERMGHTCSTWVHDPRGLLSRRSSERAPRDRGGVRAPGRAGASGIRRLARRRRGAGYRLGHRLPVGAAAGLPRAGVPDPGPRARLPRRCRPSRAGAPATYRLGLYGISAGRWLHDLVESRYGQRGTWFHLGVDHSTYHPRPVERRRDTVVFYAREVTARRAVPLGALALEELKRRRPEVRVVLFGEPHPYPLSFEYEHLGVVGPEILARHYSAATAGLCLSLTNWSLIPQEMLACGLPCVDLAGGSTETEVGESGPCPSPSRTRRRWPPPSRRCWTTRSCGRGAHGPGSSSPGGLLGAGGVPGGARAARGLA